MIEIAYSDLFLNDKGIPNEEKLDIREKSYVSYIHSINKKVDHFMLGILL